MNENKSRIREDEIMDMDDESGDGMKDFREARMSRKGIWKKIKIAVGILILAVLVLWLATYTSLLPVQFTPRFSSSYQAVFLTNGQVYFGKLYRENSSFPVLRDVYYLQVTQPPQPLQEGQTPPTNINLVKLGGELHGPQDEMRINKNQILFVEDLKNDSKVVTAIQQLENQAK